jgi:hypothetical protein
VPVSVIAQDKQGKPVADLRRDEFKSWTMARRQEIRLFVAETEKPRRTTSTQNRQYVYKSDRFDSRLEQRVFGDPHRQSFHPVGKSSQGDR